jgi:hypothetical protein
MMLKEKDKTAKDADTKAVCGAPTPALARHLPNTETVEALQDAQESHRLSDYDSTASFLQAIISS